MNFLTSKTLIRITSYLKVWPIRNSRDRENSRIFRGFNIKKKHVIHQMFYLSDLLTLVVRCFILPDVLTFSPRSFIFSNHLPDDLRNITCFQTFFQMVWTCVRWFTKMKHLSTLVVRCFNFLKHLVHPFKRWVNKWSGIKTSGKKNSTCSMFWKSPPDDWKLESGNEQNVNHRKP
jgi:hypothetical protein